jgi:predicted RNA-binding Zn-ribbon protein involved in translation (DUF1610 family)
MDKKLVASELIKVARSLLAVYHHDVGRVYKRSKGEVEKESCICPKCKDIMERQPFSRGVKIYICPGCGWKIPSNKVI